MIDTQDIFFYPHKYLRDRQLDVIKQWNSDKAKNRDDFLTRTGNQVSKVDALNRKSSRHWKRWIPFPNIKRRPARAPKKSTIYIWGGLTLSGKFIVDLDNPYSLVGFNLRSMWFWKPLLRHILLSNRCIEIRCMSEACKNTLRVLFGQHVFDKAKVHYPQIEQQVTELKKASHSECRFLFIATQFEIKGGEALLQSFSRVYENNNNCRLDIITHLPENHSKLAEHCPGIVIHDPIFAREEIHDRFMMKSDVLLLPTYVDSFGMVALEALAHGLAIIATDVYALREMIQDKKNGNLLSPPISIWDGVVPSASYFDLINIKSRIRKVDTSKFEKELEGAMGAFVNDRIWLENAKRDSINLMVERFTC